jgi:hypothetical protein
MGNTSDMKAQLNLLLDAMPVEKRMLAMMFEFPYIFNKAYRLLKDGVDVYRSKDAFGEPSDKLSGEEIALIQEGCRQVLEGRGLTKKDPFTGLGIHGFYILFRTFHYTLDHQSLVGRRDNGMLDEMHMRHVMRETEVVYFNLVVHEDIPDDWAD